MSTDGKNPWNTQEFLAHANRKSNRENSEEFCELFKRYSREADIDQHKAFSQFCSGFRVKEDVVLERQLERKRRKLQNKRRKAEARKHGFTPTTKPQCSTTQSFATQDSESAPLKKIIWVAYPDNPAPWNVKDSKSLCIEILNSTREMGGLSWLDDYDIDHPPHGLGSFSSRTKDMIFLHQGLATMLIAKSMSSIPIELHTWKWLETMLRAQNLLDYLTDTDGRKIPAVIILHCTTTKPKTLLHLSTKLRQFAPKLVRSWPASSEIEQDLTKRDWMILDQIAASSTNPSYRFRPKTCPGTGICQLSDKKVTFAKREHSNGGSHTGCLLMPDRGFLQCDLPYQKVDKKRDPDGFHWHHQQYIDSLDSREFRVQIAMKADRNGIRGVRGHVISKTTTKPGQNSTVLSRAFDPFDLKNEDCGWYTEEKLDTFALWVVDRILERPDALELFGSLQVGVRLDIGFCHGSPFVNEIVRANSAHWYSLSGSAEPFIGPCKAIAISLLSHLGCLKVDSV